MLKTTISLAALLAVSGPALADDEAYLAAGKRTAEANCAQCHNIEAGGAFKLYPPSFQSIAVYMNPDVIRMKIMYPDHAVLMPQYHEFMFSENLDNLVGYILSLEE